MDLQFTLNFLKELSNNNRKEWMDDHKKQYLEAKAQVVELVGEVISKASTFAPELSGLDPKKTLFRINRDIRFSKNKDPYKTNFGASIVEGGRQSGNPGFYLHVMPGNNMVGGGIYQPSPAMLTKVRQEIDYNGREIREIIDQPTFKKMFGEPYSRDKLKIAPKGYPKDHDHIELLQLKHYVFMRPLTDKEITSEHIVDQVVDTYQTLHPFNLFLARALD